MRINGVDVEKHVLDDDQITGLRLLDFLRDELGLTGAKEGCGVGECGSCTVLVNGRSVCACLVLVGQVLDSEIETVENLANAAPDLQQAFVDHQAVQCGYCIPGVLMSCHGLLRRTPAPTDADIDDALSGNLCRCTGYNRFHDAVHATAGCRREGR